jgi:hypothetical protein
VHEASEILGDLERRRVRLSSVQLCISLIPPSRNTTFTIGNFLIPTSNLPPALNHRPSRCPDPTLSPLFALQDLNLKMWQGLLPWLLLRQLDPRNTMIRLRSYLELERVP